MGEIPANVILAEDFAARFDGFSIGSNDLTQLTLGIDRDAEELADLFDESDPAVLWMIESLIARAHKAGAKVGPLRAGAKQRSRLCQASGEGRDRFNLGHAGQLCRRETQCCRSGDL